MKRESGIRNMTAGSPLRHILVFTLPLLAGNFLQQFYNMVDSWVVGNFVSDAALAAAAEEAEREIDQKEREVENLCLKLLLQQQPVARDLREISSALKMISDLERIGDQAADIAELTRFVRLPDGPGRQRIEEMSKAVIRMVTDSVDSFVKRDLELAREVCREDDQVDDLFNQVKKELIGLIAADADSGELWLDLIMVAKYLERIGDHATNVAEWVEYSITGNHPSNN